MAHAARSRRRASRSIFMRPPRPWPSWRRAMSASIASRSSSRPAGRPSTTQVRPGPCDSPAVVSFRRHEAPECMRAQTVSSACHTGRPGSALRAAAAAPVVLDALAPDGMRRQDAAVGQPAVAVHALVGLLAVGVRAAQHRGAGLRVAARGGAGGGRGDLLVGVGGAVEVQDVHLVLHGAGRRSGGRRTRCRPP